VLPASLLRCAGFCAGELPARVRKCLPVLWLLLPLALYLVLRIQALAPLEVTDVSGTVAGTTDLPGADAMRDRFRIPDGQRLMDVVGLWYEAIKIQIWPDPLSLATRAISRLHA
jgi:hypothetical protein